MTASDSTGAAQAYLAAWRLYTIGRWPVMSSPKKVESYAKAQAAFAAYGRLVTPAIEPLSIPFEGRDIKLWLQKPAGADRPPVTINIGGSDLWKDSVAIQARGFLPHGIAAIAVDKPGTADAPVSAAEATASAAPPAAVTPPPAVEPKVEPTPPPATATAATFSKSSAGAVSG